MKEALRAAAEGSRALIALQEQQINNYYLSLPKSSEEVSAELSDGFAVDPRKKYEPHVCPKALLSVADSLGLANALNLFQKALPRAAR